MTETKSPSEGEKLLQKVHGLSALLFLYQTKPDQYQEQIEQTQEALANTAQALFEMNMEKEIIQHIGALLLSSLLPTLPKSSELAQYIKVTNILEPETQPRDVKELVSSFDNIFVLLGKKASGKGTISEIMTKEYGVQGMATSDWLRGVARARNIDEPFNPIVLRELGDELRQEFGGDVLVWLTLQEYKNKDVRNVVFDGLRDPAELTNLENVTTIWIEAPDELRLERVISRARPGDPQTLDELRIVDKKSFPKADILRSMCQNVMTNTSNDMTPLRNQVDTMMSSSKVLPIKAIVSI